MGFSFCISVKYPDYISFNLFCDKNDAQIVDLNDAYYNGISRRRGSQVSNLHHYQVDVFYAVIDMQLQELNHRFNEVNDFTSMYCLFVPEWIF